MDGCAELAMLCPKCKVEKDEVEFIKPGPRIYRICRQCSREKARDWRAKNPQRLRENIAKWLDKDSGANRLLMQKKRAANYLENRDRYNERSTAWKDKNYERHLELSRLACARALDNLGDSYVRRLLLINTSGLTKEDLPASLVELKRVEMKIKRLIKEKKS